VDAIEGLLIAVLVIAIGWLVLVAFLWLHRPTRELAAPALRLIPDLARLVRDLLADDATPRSVRLVLGGPLAYLVSPIDLIPDFIPVIGSADDVIIAAVVLRWAGRRLGVDDLRRRWRGDPAGFEILRKLMAI
jgi:uncharacterized membrane protein YkvA (DUF1232 family)